MNKDVKALWTAALRSGEYKQGQGTLRDYEDNFCCLGVLCDLAEKAGVLRRPTLVHGVAYEYAKSTGTLPEVVSDWSGLEYTGRFAFDSTDIGVFFRSGEHDTLMSLNDAGMSFKDIANVIEKWF